MQMCEAEAEYATGGTAGVTDGAIGAGMQAEQGEEGEIRTGPVRAWRCCHGAGGADPGSAVPGIGDGQGNFGGGQGLSRQNGRYMSSREVLFWPREGSQGHRPWTWSRGVRGLLDLQVIPWSKCLN